MATKQLSIIINSVDQSSASTRKIGAGLIDMGEKGAKGANKATAALKSLGQGLASVGKMIAGGALFGAGFAAGRTIFDRLSVIGQGGFLSETTKELEAVNQAAERLGLTIEDTSRLRFAAVVDGRTDWLSFADSIAVAQKNIAQFALNGGGRAKDVIEALGLTLKNQRGELRGIGELLPEIADKLADLGSEDRVLVSANLFGTSGQNVLNILGEGGEKLRKFYSESDRLGATFTKNQTQLADDYRDAISKVDQAWLGVKASIVTEVAPALTQFLENSASRTSRLPDLIRGAAVTARAALQLDESQERAAARATLLQSVEKIGDLLGTAAIESGKLLGIVGAETFKIAFVGLAPVIGDIFRDAFGFATGNILNESSLVTQVSRATQKAASIRGESAIGSEVEAQALRVRKSAIEARASDLQSKPQNSDEERRSLAAWGQELAKLEVSLDVAESRTVRLKRAEAELSLARQNFTDQQRDRNAAVNEQIKASIQVIQGESRASFNAIREAALAAQAEADALIAAGAERRLQAQFPLSKIPGPLGEFNRQLLDGAGNEEPKVLRQLQLVGEETRNVAIEAERAGDELKRVFDVYKLRSELRAGLNADRLEFGGDTRGAERLRLVEDQRRKLAELADSGVVFGADDELQTQLLTYNTLTFQRFDAETKAMAAVRALTEADEQYRQGLERRSQLVQSGTIDEFQATRQNEQAAEAVRRLGRSTVEELEQIRQGFGAAGVVADEYRAKIELIISRLAESSRYQPRTFESGLKSGFGDFYKSISDDAEQAREASLRFSNTLLGNVTPAIQSTINDLGQAGEAWRKFGETAINELQAIVIELLVIRALKGVFKLFGGSGDASGLAMIIPSDDFRAKGGPVAAGRSYIVGEEGPEIVNFPRSGTVYPNSALNSLVSRRGSLGGVAGASDGSTMINLVIGGNSVTISGGGDEGAMMAELERKIALAQERQRKSVLDEVIGAVQQRPAARARLKGAIG